MRPRPFSWFSRALSLRPVDRCRIVRWLPGALTVVVLSATLAGQGTYVPERVFTSAKKQFADFEVLLADAAKADVLFVGEEHDDPNTHRLEGQLLEGLARRRGDIVLSLEMFERDVQEALGHFAMGHLTEAEFLSDARPWPRYATDYKPLVDFAIGKNWPVVAANVPRALAAEVSKAGLGALATKSAATQAWFAHDLRCSKTDRSFKRFQEAMTTHDETGGAPVLSAQSLGRYYDAQCLKDETMGESIAEAYTAGAIGGKRPLVVSVNGAFHTDFGDGLVERTRRRLPGKRLVIVTIQPVESLDELAPDAETRRRADYVIYTVGKKPVSAPTTPPGAAPSAGSSSSAR